MEVLSRYFDTNTVWWPYIANSVVIAIALVIAFFVYIVIYKIFTYSHRVIAGEFIESTKQYIKVPGCFLTMVIALHMASPLLKLNEEWKSHTSHILLVLTIVAFGWFLISFTRGWGNWLLKRHAWNSATDNFEARQISTRVHVTMRALRFVIYFLTFVGIAMTIPSLRSFGVSIFASAGVAGLAIGIAARPTLSNLTAGLQIGFTQPIRIDDVVVVENQWGRIEEIGNTYVVVRIWDNRRLIVPLTYFLEKPFENWTHSSSNILNTVFFYVDFTMPVEAMRQELNRILKETKLWDGQVATIAVTNIVNLTMEIRALVSSSIANNADLQYYVREKMVEFLQREYPQSLPRNRQEEVPAVNYAPRK